MVLDQDVRAWLFDFDGTLFHLPVDWVSVRQALGLVADAKIGPMLQQYIDRGDDASLAVVTHHEVAAVGRGTFVRGALAGLRAAAEAGARTAIVTRNSRHAVLAALALGSGADDPGRVLVIGREDVRRLKPDPDGLRLAMDRLGVSPADTVLVGDTYHDVQAARVAGVRSVVVRNSLLAYPPAGADGYAEDVPSALRRVGSLRPYQCPCSQPTAAARDAHEGGR